MFVRYGINLAFLRTKTRKTFHQHICSVWYLKKAFISLGIYANCHIIQLYLAWQASNFSCQLYVCQLFVFYVLSTSLFSYLCLLTFFPSFLRFVCSIICASLKKYLLQGFCTTGVLKFQAAVVVNYDCNDLFHLGCSFACWSRHIVGAKINYINILSQP